ncbi:MAG: tRNA adenosine(34) deaminase TadA [Lentihominibacter sp.]|nr:tRNA adenosine(34) deaminase TadA [Lentihominibacter sp.]
MSRYMQMALDEAAKAAEAGEVPVGAVIVHEDRVIARAHNLTITLGDPTAHAEILAIREAAKAMGGWRLPGCSMYVTTEPCSMCAGAIVHARIGKLYIGTADPKTGACGSLYNIPQDRRLNHYTEIETGIMREECSQILKDFFRKLRHAKAEEKV